MHRAALETTPKQTIPQKFGDKLINDVRTAESKLREFLSSSGSRTTLPDRVLPEPVVDESTKRKRTDSSMHPGGQATGLMAVPTFKDGALVETVATKAHDLGLSKGVKVVVDKTEFVVKELTQDLMTVVAQQPRTLRSSSTWEIWPRSRLSNRKPRKKRQTKHPMIACLEMHGRWWRSLMWRKAFVT
jgi:hypothetical protein